MGDNVLKPKVLVLDGDDRSKCRLFRHFKARCDIYMDSLTLPASYTAMVTEEFTLQMATDRYKRDALCNLVDPEIWEDIESCTI